MNIIGKDEHGKNIINNCKAQKKSKKIALEMYVKKWLSVGLTHMQKNLFLLLMIKVQVIKSIKNW